MVRNSTSDRGMSSGSRPVMTLGSSGTSPTWRWTSRAVPSTRSRVADRRVPCLGVLRAGDVTPAEVAAEGLAERGLGGEGGDGEDFVAGFEGAAAAARENSLASDDGHHHGALGELQLVGAAAHSGGVIVEGDLHQRDAAVLGA